MRKYSLLKKSACGPIMDPCGTPSTVIHAMVVIREIIVYLCEEI